MSDPRPDVISTEDRKIIDLCGLGFRRMLSCGRYDYSKAHPPLPGQRHENWIVITYLSKGFQIYQIDGKQVELRGGQMMRIFPGESYGTGNFPEQRGMLNWLIVSTARITEKTGSFGMDPAAAGELLDRLADRSKPRVAHAPAALPAAFDAVFGMTCFESPLARATLRHHLLSVLLCCGESEASGDAVSPLASQLGRHLAADSASMPLAAEMAAISNLSTSSYYERFSKETGMTPKEFVMRWKMKEGVARLKEGKSVTDTAHALGFSSSQQFAVMMKRHTGRLPGDWKPGGAI